MSETKFDSQLLQYNLARHRRVAVSTYQNAPPGSIDIERHALGNPFCYRSTKIVDQGFILKTIIIADPTLGMIHNVKPLQVAKLIKLLLDKENAVLYLWTGEFIRITTLDDFWCHYRAITSLLHNELELFKEQKQLNQDNLIVLDNTSLQAIAHYITSALDEPPEACFDSQESCEKKSIEPRYFTSDTLMLYDSKEQNRVLAWHKEHDYPLHLKLNGFAESKLPDFLSYIQKFNQIFLYFNELIHCDVDMWLTYFMELPLSQIIGVYQGPELPPRSINALLNIIKHLPELRFLSINLPKKYDFYPEQTGLMHLANLDLSNARKLHYLSIGLFKTINLRGVKLDSLLDAEASSLFLKNLPPALSYLYLPIEWTYSFPVLKRLLTEHLPNLKELGCTNSSTTKPASMSPGTERILFEDDSPHPIALPKVKIIKQEQMLPIKGIEKNQRFMPFALDKPTILDFPDKKSLNFINHYNKIEKYFTRKHMTLGKGIAYIDKVLRDNNLTTRSCLVLDTDELNLNIELLSLIMDRLPNVQEILISCLELSETTLHRDLIKQINTYILPDSPQNLYSLKLTVFNEYESDFINRILYKFYTRHLHLGMDFNADCFKPHLQAIKSITFQWRDEAEICKHLFPDIVISRNYACSCENEEYNTTFDELEANLLAREEDNVPSELIDPLGNDTDTIETPSSRLSARQLFYTLNGQPVPIHYNRLSVQSINNAVEIESSMTIYPGKTIRFDHVIPDEALICEATHHYNPETDSNVQIIPMLRPQDTLYKISTTHAIELTYDSKKRVYLMKGLDPNVAVTVMYQFNSTAFVSSQLNTLQQTPDSIINAATWIDNFRHLFSLFNTIQFTKEGIVGLDSLSSLPAAQLPYLILAYCADFGSGSLVLANQHPLPHEIDTAILHQKFGACRHRSKLAFKILSALVNMGMCSIEVNLVTSDVHQFLELLIDDEWITVCLGGFNAQIDIQNTQKDKTTQATQHLSQLEEMTASPLYTSKQPFNGGFELNNQGWEALYAETVETSWNNIIQGFDPYAGDFLEQLPIFNNDDLFFTREAPREAPKQAQDVIQNIPEVENPFLLTYPSLNFDNSEAYRWWLQEQLESSQNKGCHLLLVVDSIDKKINTLQRNTCDYITENDGYFASISDFQQIKFAELHVDEQGNKHFRANDLGRLVDEGQKGDVLWVTINQYQAATINPLFDHRKKIRDKQIPHEVHLIAIMAQCQFQEMSDDFTSRFDAIYKLDVQDFQPDSSPNPHDEVAEAYFVFGEPLLSFEEFFGYYIQNHGQLRWHEGWLTQQIKKGVNQITLINPPSYLSEFDVLMNSVQKGYYYSNGELITLPIPINVTYKKQAYNYPPCTIVSAHQRITIDFVLNKTTYASFFRGTYELLNDGSMRHHPGIDNPSSRGYTVLLSESPAEGEWYSLLCYIRDSELPVRFALAPGVTIPKSSMVTCTQDEGFEQMSAHVTTIYPEYTHLFPLGNSINWVESDAMLELMRNSAGSNDLPPIYLAHDASIADLLGSIVAREGQPLTFSDTKFNDAIRQGKEVVLYGNPGREVRHFLESVLCTQPYLIINGKKQNISGSLSLYFTPNKHSSIIPVCLGGSEHTNTLRPDSGIMITPHNAVEKQLYREIIPRIDKQRISVISGLPQSGKSWLLHQLATRYYTIHQGITHLDSWLTEGGILLIDHCQHATLEEHSLIEQVHHAEKSLYIKGQFYPLSSEHRMLLVVPSAKQLTSFFTVNTPSMHCQPYDEDVMLEAIIKPFWRHLNTQYSTLEYWAVILNMLNQLKRHNGFSGVNQLLMALAYVDELAQHKQPITTAGPLDSLKELCDLTLCLMCPAQTPKERQKDAQKIALALITSLLPAPLGVKITPMQTVIICNLMLHLRLVERARENPLIAQLLVKGMIIEGSPGIGKTYLTQQLFHAMGYQEVTDRTMCVHKGYVIAPADDLRMCKDQLMLAKEKGYLIFFDELNTLAEELPGFAERSLIAQLIDALEPDHQEQPGSGFYMLASQNTAASFGNRLSLPKELSIRCVTLRPGEFRKQDYQHLCSSLHAKEPETMATEMKSALRDYKQTPHKFKKPTVRSLLGFLNTQQVNQSGHKRKRESSEEEQGKRPGKKLRH